MAIFGIETENDESASLYLLKTQDRLQSPNLFKNPFTTDSKMKKIHSLENKSAYAFILEPVYPPFFWFGLLGFIVLFLFTGWTWMTIFPAFVFCLGVFWTPLPSLLALWLGLRKADYRGRIRLLSKSEIIKRVL